MTNAYDDVLRLLGSGSKTLLITDFKESRKWALDYETVMAGQLPTGLPPALAASAVEVLRTGYLKYIDYSEFSPTEPCGVQYLLEPFFPRLSMVILGGGHIALPLHELGARVGFEVTVVDDRPSFANPSRFPRAKAVLCESFERCFDLLTVNESTYVILVTRGHRYDLDCLRQVLKYETGYLGMIGSRRRVAALREIVLAEGFDAEKIARLHAPIGLEIGAVTPEEIAVSIIAEVIQSKRMIRPQGKESRQLKIKWADWEADVLETLATGAGGPVALATVVSTIGSTPHEAGTKMIVYPDRRVIGTIGGGCLEAEIISKAMDIADRGGHKIVEADLSGEAEDEGMVCGGSMKILLEKLTNTAIKAEHLPLAAGVPVKAMPLPSGCSLLPRSASGGCDAKIGPGALSSLLDGLPPPQDARLLVGYAGSDDAAVYQIDDEQSFVMTVDFLPPMVDDARAFGRIAAANALSDIYAMGGRPLTALNILCFPQTMDMRVLREVLAGGAEKIREAGAVMAGGHSIYDQEAKYGLAVTGLVRNDSIMRNNTPRPGDRLILTKPLGVGIIMAAHRAGAADPDAMRQAAESMQRLNLYAAEKMRDFAVSACTDITGFGLLAHALEMAADKRSIVFYPRRLPYFAEAYAYAADGHITVASRRNRAHLEGKARVDTLPFPLQELIFDPQTSGGLLISVAARQADELLAAIRRDDPQAALVGEISWRKDDVIIMSDQ